MAISQHFAQFYEQEEFLLKTASDYLTTGMTSKATCIVIATREHRDGITQRLQQNGRDVVDASRQGTYIELDAATALSQLEELLNTLLDRFSSSTLLCAYPFQSFTQDIDRTGLTTIQGFSELLSTKEWGPEEVKEYASYIMTDSQRLTRLIEEVLDLERIKLGKVDRRRELVDMNALLRQLAAQTQQTTSKHTLVCQLDETLLPVPGDADKFIQVSSNLLSNAVKYSPHGGEIVLSSQRKQETLQISIQDQGIGIPAKAQHDIFVPYNRMGSEKTHYIQGIGLGLSVVREIIGLYGGTIWVESAPEHGSIFHFTLPLTRRHSDASPEEEGRECDDNGFSTT